MGVVHNPDGEYAREMQRWNTPKRLGGYGPDGYEPFPKMLYKADRWENGKAMVGHPGAATGEPVATAFSTRCQHVVADADAYLTARNAGWCDSPDEALTVFENEQREVARAAAEAQHGARRMSDRAQAEFTEAQADEDHVPDPAAPYVSPADKKRAYDKARRAKKEH